MLKHHILLAHTTLPPELRLGWVVECVEWAGFTWFHLLLYGLAGCGIGALGDFCIRKGLCRTPGYLLFVIAMALLGIYFLCGAVVYNRAPDLGITIEPNQCFWQASSILWGIGMLLLHRHVVSG